ESAELALQVKATKEGANEIKLGVVKGGTSLEKEDVLTITYKLKDWMEAARAETELRRADTLHRPNPVNLAKWNSIMIKRWSLPKSSDSDIEFEKFKKSVVELRKHPRPMPSNDALRDAIKGAMKDYNRMKKEFGNVCFDVEISFEVTSKA